MDAPATVTGAMTFTQGPVTNGTPSHYLLTLTEAGGAVLKGIGALTDSQIQIPLVPVGTWTGTVALVDANENPLFQPVSDPTPLVLSAPAPVLFNIPTALQLSAAPATASPAAAAPAAAPAASA